MHKEDEVLELTDIYKPSLKSFPLSASPVITPCTINYEKAVLEVSKPFRVRGGLYTPSKDVTTTKRELRNGHGFCASRHYKPCILPMEKPRQTIGEMSDICFTQIFAI